MHLRAALFVSWAAAAAAATACTFDPNGVGWGAADGAPGVPDGAAPAPDGPLLDDGAPAPDGWQPPDAAPLPDTSDPLPPDAAPPDAPLPDAPLPDAPLPDAPPADVCGDGTVVPPEQCDDGNTWSGDGCSATCAWEPSVCGPGADVAPVTPATNVFGSTEGEANNLESASCGGASSPEDIFTLTLTGPADVRVSTEFMATSFRTVTYVRTVCDDPMSELGCASAGPDGDVFDLWSLPAGTYFVVVDGYAGASGAYQLRVTVRPIVPVGSACDPAVITNRCEDGSSCVMGVCVSDGATCDSASAPLALEADVTGTTSGGGPSDYQPSCASSPSGPEDVYHVDVPAGGPHDLLVEVTGVGTFNPLAEITSTCGDPTTGLGCANSSTSPGRQELAVAPLVAAGRSYVVVDGWNGGSGAYDAVAWLRDVVGPGDACAADLRASRCSSGYCVDLDDDGVTTCSALTPDADGESNVDPCTTPDGPFHDDFVWAGDMIGGTDLDVVRIEPTVDSILTAVVYTGPNTRCQLDLEMGLLTGACDAPTPISDADDEGLGACPELVGIPVEGGADYWLAIRRAPTGFGTGPYVVVVELRPL